MRTRRLIALAGTLAILGPALLAAEDRPVVRRVDFESIVHPWSAARITKAIDLAETQNEDLVLIRVDTPGGTVDAMNDIVKRMLNSKVPVVVWVGPSGSHAASAGFFILSAADVAAMAPGTRTGAASTVFMGGENREDDVLLKKANEDGAALCRSIADRRGRDVEACEEAVFSAKAWEETVALERGVIDLIAATEEELLEALDGRVIRRFDGSNVTLRTGNAEFRETEFSFRHQFMEILALPMVAYLLFTLGMVGIYVEFNHPGAIFPGVVGALCLLLFLLSAQALPVNAIGVLLILLGAVMFILEIKVTSFGMLTVGGVIALLIGSFMLIDGPIPEMRVPAGVSLPIASAVALLFIFVLRLAIKAQRERVGTGVEGLVGEAGDVTRALDPEGKVFIRGEIWNAVTVGGPLARGTRVRVVAVDELTLTVEAVAGREEGTS